MPVETKTTESVENSLVAPVSTFDEPPAETTAAPSQVEPEQPTPEGKQPEAGPQPGEGEPEGEKLAEGEEEQPLGYDDLLPSRQAKKFPDEFLSLAAQRWNIKPEDLEDVERGPYLKQLLTDKINSDILIRNQELESAAREREQEVAPKEEKKPEETVEQKQPQPISWEQLSTGSKAIAETLVTEQGADSFAPRFYDAMLAIAGLREKENPDPKEVKAANRAMTEVMTEFGVMLLAQTQPQIVQTILRDKSTAEILAPLISGEIERREGTTDQESEVYEEARSLVAKEPEFRDIVNLQGEGGPLEQAANAYRDEFGKEMFDIQFQDRATGKPLPPLQNAAQQLRFAVRYLRGLNYQEPVQQVKQAIQRGRQLERVDSQKGNLGRLRTGKTSGQFVPATTSADDEMGDMVNAFDKANPLSVEAQSNRPR